MDKLKLTKAAEHGRGGYIIRHTSGTEKIHHDYYFLVRRIEWSIELQRADVLTSSGPTLVDRLSEASFYNGNDLVQPDFCRRIPSLLCPKRHFTARSI